MSAGIADHRVTKGSPPCSSNTKTSALTRMMTGVTTERCRGRRDASPSGIRVPTLSSALAGAGGEPRSCISSRPRRRGTYTYGETLQRRGLTVGCHCDLDHRGESEGKRRATANRVQHQAFAFSMLPTSWQLPTGERSRLADGGPSEGEFVDVQVADFPLERLARNAELRRRAARAGNPAERLLERGFDQGLLTVRQGGHGRAVRRLALLAREPRLIDHERLPLTQHDGTLDHVLELAHVARPVVGREPLQGLLLNIADDLPRLLCEAVDKVFDQDRNVLRAFAERRQADGEDVQTVEQVLPERAVPARSCALRTRGCYWLALSMIRAMSCGREMKTRCPAGSSVTRACIRFAMKRSSSGLIARSCVPTTYHDGTVFQAGATVSGSPSALPAIGFCAVANARA